MARIALVTSSFLPRKGGVEEHVANVATRLQDRGHHVVIWSVDQGDDVPSHFRGIALRYLPCPLPARRISTLTALLTQAPRALRAWRHAVSADRPDLLHVQCFGPNGVYATAAASLTSMPLVYSHHGETFMDADDAFNRSALLRTALRRVVQSASAVTSCSQFAADDLSRFGADPGQVEVVFNGIDLNEARDGEALSLPTNYLLGVGRLVANKGFSALLQAFAKVTIRGEYSDVDLVIGGDGPEIARLTGQATELGLASRVHLPGPLTRSQVGQAMAGSIALIVPSLIEGFGITILEGWRAGVPVLATRYGGPPEFVTHGETGLLIDPLDVDALAEQIRFVLANPQIRARLGSAGHAAVQRFTWDKPVDQYEQIYRRAMNSQTHRVMS